MPKKLFKKYLPDPMRIRENRAVRWLGPWLGHHNLWHLNRRSVAGGVAVGIFTGLIPGPVQMLFAALFSILFRVNLPVACVTTLYTNPFTILPLYYVAYHIGKFVMGSQNGPMPVFEFSTQTESWFAIFINFMHWLGSLGQDFFIGLFVLASLLSVSSYFLVRGLWRGYMVLYWRRRQRRVQP